MHMFALMINSCEPSIDDVIDFMDGVSLAKSAHLKERLKMCSTVGVNAILW